MIQIITNNKSKYNEFSNDRFIISRIDEFQSFDNYDITIVDISDSSLWYNKGSELNSINQVLDFKSINNAINKSKKSDILIVFPQNIYYQYSYIYKSSGYVYDKKKKIKDFKDNFIDIVNRNLISMNILKINYGKTYTKINKNTYQADFSFLNVDEKDIVIKAENNNDSTVIKNGKVLLTSLELNKEEEIINLLREIFKDKFTKITEEPEWIKDINFYTDKKCKEEIAKLDLEIEKLKEKKISFESDISENSKYKSILYETGDILAKQINIMLSEIFEYDMSNFKDTYEEDGLIKLEDITFIVETKGLNNEISGHNVSDACNHLIIYEDKLEEEKRAENVKCLFIVAYQRNKNINERVEIKERLEKIAKANNTLIIDTRVFLQIFEDFLNKKINKEQIKTLFQDNIGKLFYKSK